MIKVGGCDEWPTYIKWAIQNGHSGKFAPKVYSLKFHDEFYVAIVERLVCTINQMIGEYHGAHRTDQARAYETVWNDDCEAVDLVAYIKDLQHVGLSGDFHGGNFMIRSDGSIVVTDPVAASCTSDKFRIKSGACL